MGKQQEMPQEEWDGAFHQHKENLDVTEDLALSYHIPTTVNKRRRNTFLTLTAKYDSRLAGQGQKLWHLTSLTQLLDDGKYLLITETFTYLGCTIRHDGDA